MKAFRKLGYLVTCDLTTSVLTDHRNLLFAFNPVVMDPLLGRHKVLKFIRWALYLSGFNYIIKHVPGFSNTRLDIMTRWMRRYHKTVKIKINSNKRHS